MIQEKAQEKLDDLLKAIDRASADYKEKVIRNQKLDEKYKLRLQDIDGVGKNLEERETALAKKLSTMNDDYRKMKDDESKVVKRFGEYKVAKDSLNESKAKHDKDKKELEKKQEEFTRHVEREKVRLSNIETTGKNLIKVHQDKINELEDIKKKFLEDKEAELKKLKELVGDQDAEVVAKRTAKLKNDLIIARENTIEAQKLRAEWQNKANTYKDHSHEIEKRRAVLDKMEAELKNLSNGIKLREEAMKEREANAKRVEGEQADRQVYLEALNRKVDQKIEIHKLAKELGIGTER